MSLTDDLIQARAYYARGSFGRCLQTLEGAGETALEQRDFWLLRSSALRRLRRVDEAVKTARAGLARWPEDVVLLDVLGLALMASGDATAADHVFLGALSIAPGDLSLLAHHADALATAGSFDEAERVIANLMAIAPNSAFALEARAQVAVRTGDPSAEAFVAELLALNPENQRGHALRGHLALRHRRARPAAKAFATAAALNPENVVAARSAREMRLAAHPLLRPSSRIFMLGRRRAMLIYVAIVLALVIAHQTTIAIVFAALWLVFMVATPRALRFYYRRRYGGL